MTLTEYLHDFRFPSVRCGGRIWLYGVTVTTWSDVDRYAWCEKCRQTAVWNG